MDNVAIVTGSGRGIGAGCAKALAAAGFKVSLMSPSERSENLAAELGGIGMRGSVQDITDIAKLVDYTMSTYGRIDAVINNMGHGGGKPETVHTVQYDPDYESDILEIPDEIWYDSLDMYVLNVVRMARQVTPIMIEQGGGSIVNISSFNALEPRPMYPMSLLRGALHIFTKNFVDRYARDNVRMNNLLPGFVENIDLTDNALKGIPARRTATFEEIGNVAVFLASDASSYVTGQNILADGGMNRAVR
ncbi:MAG: SDR family oxidoreductase [Chloroflexota bacterium]